MKPLHPPVVEMNPIADETKVRFCDLALGEFFHWSVDQPMSSRLLRQKLNMTDYQHVHAGHIEYTCAPSRPPAVGSEGEVIRVKTKIIVERVT